MGFGDGERAEARRGEGGVKKFIIGYDVLVPGLYEIEADDEVEAMDLFGGVDPKELLDRANHESATIINEDVTTVWEEKP